jgi:hypothetical protein
MSTADGWDKRINRYGELSGFGAELAWVYPFIPSIRCTHGITKPVEHRRTGLENLSGLSLGVILPTKTWQRYLPAEPYQKTCPQYPDGGGWEKGWFKEEETGK